MADWRQAARDAAQFLADQQGPETAVVASAENAVDKAAEETAPEPPTTALGEAARRSAEAMRNTPKGPKH